MLEHSDYSDRDKKRIRKHYLDMPQHDIEEMEVPYFADDHFIDESEMREIIDETYAKIEGLEDLDEDEHSIDQ